MRFYDGILQSAAVKNPPIGCVVLLVGYVQTGGVDIKGVRILHGELAHADQSGFGALFVAKLVLNLIPDLRKLLIAAQLFAGNLRHDLFMGHTQAQVASATVLETEHVVAHDLPAAARLPEFARMQRRKKKFLPDLVHLIANNINDAQDRALAQKQVGIETCRELANVTAADQEFMAGDFSVGRGLTQSGDKQLRPTVHISDDLSDPENLLL